MKQRVTLAAIFAVAFTVTFFSAVAVKSVNAQEPEIAQPWGTWFLRVHFLREGQPPTSPVIVTLHREGTANSSPGNMFGLSGTGIRWASPLHDVWERTGPNTIGTTCINFLFEAGTGKLLGIGRVRGELQLTDFDHISGRMYFDFLSCSLPQSCGDPTDPSAPWVVWPGTPANGLAVTAVRLKRVDIGPLP